MGIYVKSDYTTNKRDDLSVGTIDFETIWIEIDNPRAKNTIGCCAYWHLSSDIAKFTQYLQETLYSIADEDKLIHIRGDFNIDLLNYGHHTLTDNFINMMFSSHLMPSILHPTRITDTSSTLIDNIFLSNVSDCNILSGNLLSKISDHLPQFAILKDNAPEHKNITYFAYDYMKFDKPSFLSDYTDFDISYLEDEKTHLDTRFNTFYLTSTFLLRNTVLKRS